MYKKESKLELALEFLGYVLMTLFVLAVFVVFLLGFMIPEPVLADGLFCDRINTGIQNIDTYADNGDCKGWTHGGVRFTPNEDPDLNQMTSRTVNMWVMMNQCRKTFQNLNTQYGRRAELFRLCTAKHTSGCSDLITPDVTIVDGVDMLDFEDQIPITPHIKANYPLVTCFKRKDDVGQVEGYFEECMVNAMSVFNRRMDQSMAAAQARMDKLSLVVSRINNDIAALRAAL